MNTIGENTLNIISKSINFNFWIYSKIKKYLTVNILEIGSGIGNISSIIIKENNNLTLSDIDENYLNKLAQTFPNNNVIKLDIGSEIDISLLEVKYDTIVLLNVLEHIENDDLVIRNCKKLLNENGKLIIQVPAFKFLYNKFDIELNHYKRYNKIELKNLATNSNLKIEKLFYFNSIGTIGWFINGNIFRRKIIPKNQMKFYDKLIPIVKFCDYFLNRFIGLSIICVLKSTDKTV